MFLGICIFSFLLLVRTKSFISIAISQKDTIEAYEYTFDLKDPIPMNICERVD